MKLAKKLLGIAAIFAVIGFMALPLTGCPTDVADNVEKPAVVPGDTRPTPTAKDFDIGNLTQEKGNDIVPVTITAKPEKSDGDITIYYNNSKTLPTEIGTYPVTFDVAETDDWKAAYGLSAGTLSIVERIFTDITALGTWLSEQASNDKDTPYSIALDVSDISTLRATLNNNPNKYVSIVLPDKITTIPNYLFYGTASPYGCDTLTGITIPSGVTSIEERAFQNCANLTSVTIGNSVTSIGERAFSGCNSLAGVTIGSGVTSIWYYAFSGCTSLTSIIIPDGVTSIGQNAFFGCTALTSITIPDSVIEVGSDVFTGTPWFDSQPEGVFYIGSIAVGYVGTAAGDIQFKEGTKIIASGAFSSKSGITSVTIPNSVTSIGQSAFSGCTGLTSVTIGNSVTSIEMNAFRNCANLTSIIIPDSVTSLGQEAFYGCTNLTSVTIGNSVTSIKSNTFALTGLTDIIIPDNVTSIGDYAFYGCTNLTDIIIPDSVTSIGGIAFSSTGLTSVTIPDSVTSIGQNAFSICNKLTSVSIGKGIIDILYVSFGFGNSMMLATITVDPANPELSAQDNIVYNKDKTAILFVPKGRKGELSIPDSVTDIDALGFDLFEDWYNTQSDGLVYLGKIAFGYKGTMPADTNIILLDGTKTIRSAAFYGCTNLTSITIPNSVTRIGDQAFNSCTNLTSVTFQGTIVSTGTYNNAFYGLGDLRDKYLGGTGTYTTTAPVSNSSVWSKQP